jgi:pyridoxine kinase
MLKNCLVISDLCTYSKSSLTVSLPILEAQGIEACPLATSVMSTQSDGFDELYQKGLDDAIGPISGKLDELGIRFDAVYSGFLSSQKAFDAVENILVKASGALKLVDPVLGDDGRLYSVTEAGMVERMRALISKSDVITPNQTEAFLLLGLPYEREVSPERAMKLAQALKAMGPRNVVITGMRMDDGAFALGLEDKVIGYKVIRSTLPGSGDLFASLLIGFLLRSMSFEQSARQASNLVSLCIERTCQAGYEMRHGVCPALIIADLVPSQTAPSEKSPISL